MDDFASLTLQIRRIESFDALFKRLCRKARRLHLTEPSYQVLGEKMEKCDIFQVVEMGDPVKVDTVELMVSTVQISGLHQVSLNGWKFAASVEHTDKGNLVFPAPGLQIPERFSKANCSCEHCNLKRDRTHLFLVVSGEGEWKQVGRTCLQDFVGGASAAALAAQFEFLGDLYRSLELYGESERYGYEGTAAAYSLMRVVPLSLALSRTFGWVSRSSSKTTGKIATADRVKSGLGSREIEATITDADYEMAEAMIATFASLDEAELSDDLQRNLRILCNSGYCSKTSFGLACAIPACHAFRERKLERDRNLAERRANSKHVGTVGKRQEFTATIEREIILTGGLYGDSVLTIMVDDSGNVLVGGQFSYKGWNAEDFQSATKGDRVTFKATVKAHEERDGVKQTRLLRAAMVTNHTLDEEKVRA